MELTIKINSVSTLRNLVQGLALMKEKILSNKAKVNPGTEGFENLHLYYQEKLIEVQQNIISLNQLIDKNYKIPHHFCLKNELGEDSICSQQCLKCSINVI